MPGLSEREDAEDGCDDVGGGAILFLREDVGGGSLPYDPALVQGDNGIG